MSGGVHSEFSQLTTDMGREIEGGAMHAKSPECLYTVRIQTQHRLPS